MIRWSWNESLEFNHGDVFWAFVRRFSKVTAFRLKYALHQRCSDKGIMRVSGDHFHYQAVCIIGKGRQSTKWRYIPNPNHTRHVMWPGDWGASLSSVFRLAFWFRSRCICTFSYDFFLLICCLSVGAGEARVCHWAWESLSEGLPIGRRWLFCEKSVVYPFEQLVEQSWKEVARDSEHFLIMKINYKLINSDVLNESDQISVYFATRVILHSRFCRRWNRIIHRADLRWIDDTWQTWDSGLHGRAFPH